MRRVAFLGLTALAAAACGGHRSLVDTSVRISSDPPPASSSWPRYPRYPRASCWARSLGGGPLRSAPSIPFPSRPVHLAPTEIVRKTLGRFGDRRYVLRVELGPPPPVTLAHLRAYFAGVRPPANALWAYVAAPAARNTMVAEWETHLVIGGLRDEFCAAGGQPLVGWSVGGDLLGVSDDTQALGQHFPNPAPAVFRRRLALVARRYGFTVMELRLLRPRQLAPLVVVRTERDRKAFAADVPRIMRLLDPYSTGKGATAVTFEGFYFAAADDRGTFVRVENVFRGENEGGEWAWNPCDDPYPHSWPVGAKPCP